MAHRGTLVVNIERFLEGHLKASLDQYAELEPAVLGLTEFRPGMAPVVRINRDLRGSAMDYEWCPRGIQGRWRATLAHEVAHIIPHRILFEGNPDQTTMFADHTPTPPVLLRCLKRGVAYVERIHQSFIASPDPRRVSRGQPRRVWVSQSVDLLYAVRCSNSRCRRPRIEGASPVTLFGFESCTWYKNRKPASFQGDQSLQMEPLQQVADLAPIVKGVVSE